MINAVRYSVLGPFGVYALICLWFNKISYLSFSFLIFQEKATFSKSNEGNGNIIINQFYGNQVPADQKNPNVAPKNVENKRNKTMKIKKKQNNENKKKTKQ